jgi:hypothetical protein
MQYKQTPRILGEIVGSPGVRPATVLAAADLWVSSDPLPRLGPYKKRSAAQALWKLASDSSQGPQARLMALRKLIAIPSQGDTDAKHVKSQCSSGDPEDPQTLEMENLNDVNN